MMNRIVLCFDEMRMNCNIRLLFIDKDIVIDLMIKE